MQGVLYLSFLSLETLFVLFLTLFYFVSLENDWWALSYSVCGMSAQSDRMRRGAQDLRGLPTDPPSTSKKRGREILPNQGPGQYSCSGCGKVYRWKCNLTTHERLECGKEPCFKCPVCPHRSKFRGNLYKHVLSKHPEVDAQSFRRELNLKQQLLHKTAVE